MTQKTAKAPEDASPNAGTTEPPKDKAERREIKGGIPYSTSPGVLKKSLELIIAAERPDKFGTNFMETILKQSGGAARTVPPFLKKMQFIGSDGSPTILYSKFKTDSGRSQAAYAGLKNAFGELFRRNEYIHKADENTVKDVIVEITGLKKTDQIVRLMYASFDSVRTFVGSDTSSLDESPDSTETKSGANDEDLKDAFRSPPLGLSYQINIVLPETENIAVFNAIFKSLRDNLLR